MVLFDRYIRDLLFQYDCVVIPDFGGFVCSFTPAKIHPVQHRFHPPGKKISFNKMLVMNDGLLAHSMAIGEGVAYDTAMQWIQDQVGRMRSELTLGKRVSIDGLGYFYEDSAKNLLFQQESNRNFLVDSYGFTTFQALPVDRTETLKVVKSARQIEKSEDETQVKPLIHKMAKYSAAAALLSVVMLTAYKMDVFRNININEISMNPFKKEKNIYSPTDYKSLEANEERITRTPVLESEKEVVFYDFEGRSKKLKVRLRDPLPKEEKAPEIYGRYHVVGGCFGVENNAVKYVRKLKNMGYDADMNTRHNGLHVVSYQSFTSEKEARKFLKKVKSETNKQAWLLVK